MSFSLSLCKSSQMLIFSQPAKELILRELNPKRYKNVIVPSRAVECGLISREFDTVLAEYKKSTNPQMLTRE